MKRIEMRIAIKEQYDWENFGDDTLMMVTFKILKKKYMVQPIVLMRQYESYMRAIIPGTNSEAPKSRCSKVEDIVIYGSDKRLYILLSNRKGDFLNLCNRIVLNMLRSWMSIIFVALFNTSIGLLYTKQVNRFEPGQNTRSIMPQKESEDLHL